MRSYMCMYTYHLPHRVVVVMWIRVVGKPFAACHRRNARWPRGNACYTSKVEAIIWVMRQRDSIRIPLSPI